MAVFALRSWFRGQLLVEFVDLYPTIADYCGLNPPAELAGRNLRQLVNDPLAPGKPAAFTMVRRGATARGDSIRTDRWRYTEWSDGTREFYDHESDTEETVNVAATDPAVVRRLREQLDAARLR